VVTAKRAPGAWPIRGQIWRDYSGQRPNCNAANTAGKRPLGP